MDCVHQIWVQYPKIFEFNLEYLRDIAFHAYSGVFGTFLYDNNKERAYKEARKKTVSIWSYYLENPEKFQNPFYEMRNKLVKVNYLACNMRLWREHFFQYSPRKKLGLFGLKDNLSLFYQNLALRAQEDREDFEDEREDLENEIERLERKVSKLRKKLKVYQDAAETTGTKVEEETNKGEDQQSVSSSDEEKPAE